MSLRPPEPADELFRIEDDRPRDPWGDEPADARRSRLGVDDSRGVLHRIGLTIATLMVGSLVVLAMFGLFVAVNVQVNGVPWGVRFLVNAAIETVLAFFLLVVVYIWWRPPWFREIYLSVETKFLFLIRGLVLVAFAAALIGAVVSVVAQGGR